MKDPQMAIQTLRETVVVFKIHDFHPDPWRNDPNFDQQIFQGFLCDSTTN